MMEINIRSIRNETDQTLKISKQSKIIDLLEKIGENPESVVTKRNGYIVPEEEQISDGDEIEVVPIVSGG